MKKSEIKVGAEVGYARSNGWRDPDYIDAGRAERARVLDVDGYAKANWRRGVDPIAFEVDGAEVSTCSLFRSPRPTGQIVLARLDPDGHHSIVLATPAQVRGPWGEVERIAADARQTRNERMQARRAAQDAQAQMLDDTVARIRAVLGDLEPRQEHGITLTVQDALRLVALAEEGRKQRP